MEKTLESAFYMIKQKISKASSLSEKTTWEDTDLIVIEDVSDTKKMTVATFKVLLSNITVGVHSIDEPGYSAFDSTAAIQSALSAGKTVILSPGKTYNVANLVSVAGTGIICPFGRAKLRCIDGTYKRILEIKTTKFSLIGIDMDGGNVGPYNISTATNGTRVGLSIGNPLLTGVQLQDITIKDVDVYGFDSIGIAGRETVIGYSAGKRVVFDNVNCHDNYLNWGFPERFEYATFTNCYGYRGYIGIQLVGGNNSFTGCHFEYNFINAELLAGENNAHGGFVNCSFNHAIAGGFGLSSNGVTNGENFISCYFWYGNIKLTNCTGINISNCQLGGSLTITVIGGGLNRINDNWSASVVTLAFSSNASTEFKRNKTTINEASQQYDYGDYYVYSQSLTWADNTLFQSVADYPLPYSTLLSLYYGVNNPVYTFNASNGIISITGDYQFNASVGFSAGAGAPAQKITLKLKIFNSNATLKKEYVYTFLLAAGATDYTLKLSELVWCKYGETYAITLSASATQGINIKNNYNTLLVKKAD